MSPPSTISQSTVSKCGRKDKRRNRNKHLVAVRTNDGNNAIGKSSMDETMLAIEQRPSLSVFNHGNHIQCSVDDKPEQVEQRLERMCGAVKTLLECLGEDPNREGLRCTPLRYAEALLFLTKGYKLDIKDIVNNALFHEGNEGMVIVKDIEIHSLCEHHLVPFIGKMHIGYIPSGVVIGLSKLARIATMFSQRLQIQERLTREVATAIMQTVKPQGVAVVMQSSHLCMVMRGVEKTGATTITSCVLGCFENNSKAYDEFLSLVGLNKT